MVLLVMTPSRKGGVCLHGPHSHGSGALATHMNFFKFNGGMDWWLQAAYTVPDMKKDILARRIAVNEAETALVVPANHFALLFHEASGTCPSLCSDVAL